MSPKEKYRQICREAGATGLALIALILLWCVLGFGLSSSTVTICGLPLWALAGTIGIWLAAIAICAVLVHFVFRDMPLEPEDTQDKNDTQHNPCHKGEVSRRG